MNVGQVAEVAPIRPGDDLLGGDPRLALDQRIEAPPQAAVDHQRLEHVARHVRAPDPALDPRPLAAP